MKTTERMIWAAALAVALATGHWDGLMDRIDALQKGFRSASDRVSPPPTPEARPAILTLGGVEAEIERFNAARANMVESLGGLAARAESEWVDAKKEEVR